MAIKKKSKQLSYLSRASRTIYLVFRGHNDNTFILSRFLKKDFKHVFAIEKQPAGWICVDPSQHDLLSLILPCGHQDKLIEKLKAENPDFTIVKVEVNMNREYNYPAVGLISCVSVMQYFLGIYNMFVLTPHQLYKYVIKKMDGIVI